MHLIFDKIINSYKKKLPFAVYRKPNSDLVSGFFQQNDTLFCTENYTESGFVFAPFDDKNDAVLIPENESTFLEEEVCFYSDFNTITDFVEDEIAKEKYISLIEKAIENIHKKQFEKVVLSREERIKIEDFNILETYQKLLQKYTNAFVYVWYHPKVGLWLGATPETLLNISDNSFETMSLAGTQVYKETKNITWKDKEIQEQQLVTEFIKSQLLPITSTLKINKKETIKAGNLVHLKTKISGILITQNSSLKTLIKALHPTPAVCGLPREITKDFILKHENYERTFYTGFLGELNIQGSKFRVQSSSLFVNLRCMKIENNRVQMYVGGGITKDSDTEREWEETVAKSKVMKSVL
ncbi:MAG: isochorismate synthase [Polaribacter sp.]